MPAPSPIINDDSDSDSDECRRLREQIEAMTQEMRHRLRNAYAVSAALASASGREEPEHREFADGLAQRFNSMSVAQSMLLDGGVRHTLRELVCRVADTFDPERRRFTLGELPDRELGEQQARLAALVLGELATNSLKHGALGHGRSADIDASEQESALVLTWEEELDAAQGPPAGSSGGNGSGHALMTRMARAHGGSFVAEWKPGRLVVRLTMPIDA